MKKLWVLYSLSFLFSCDFTNTAQRAAIKSNENLELQELSTYAYSIEEGESTASDISKEEIQFPIWWVEKEFQQGNSPKVIVFFTDGRIYARDQQGQRLKPLGSWSYDPIYQRIFTSFGQENDLKISTHSDGSWDGNIYFQQTQLIPGSPDYTTANILGKYISNVESTENIYQNYVYTPKRAKVMAMYIMHFLPQGTLKFAGMVDGTEHDLESLCQENRSEIIFKWRIAPLGDTIEFYDLPELYNGLMMEVKYNAHQSIMIRTFAHKEMPIYKKIRSQSGGNSLQIMKNSGGQALMTLLSKN